MNRRKAEWGNIYFWFWMFLFIFISKKDWNNLRYAHFRALLLVEILEQPIRMLKNEDRVIVRWNWFLTSTQGLILYRLCCKFCIGPALGHFLQEFFCSFSFSRPPCHRQISRPHNFCKIILTNEWDLVCKRGRKRNFLRKIFSGNQCDQIGQYLKVLGNNFSG